MKLTKKLEAEILKTYYDIWDAYLKGDMRTFASILDDDCYIIGSAAGEVFNNKKAAVKYYRSTSEQITGKAEFRNRKINVMPVEKGFMVNEESDFYLLIDDRWTFYGQGRISSLFHKKNNKWKVIHQHGSFPDSKTEEGEQVNTDKIKAENIQLRDAVKRRTEELENKNRELEIEAAVEKVRAKALSMHSSEEIREVVRTLRNELFGLKLTGVTAVTICLKQDDGRVRFWDITDLETAGRYSADITFDMAQTDPQFYLQKIWSSKKKIIAFEQDSNDLKRTLKWLGQYDKQTADEITELIKVNKIKRGWHRAVKLANGRLITDFINEPPTEIESILLKMGAAFDLAYKRFLDLKNAEAQAKEARVELALERVRARAMAMHNSNELAELVSTVFNELTQLEFKLTSCIIWIHDHENTKNTLWIASTEMNKPAEPFLVNVFHNDFFKSISHAWKSKDTKWVYTFTGKEKKNFEKAFFKEIPQLPIPLKNALQVPEHVVFSASFNNFGALEIVETEALTEEKFEILHRFGKVFDSSYTRFNDLKKAEAQAREAQIETGLERVRSKTMAMYKSEEVTGIAVTLNEELLKLGFEGGSTIIIIDKETGDTEQWTGFSEDKTLQSCYVPYFKHPCHDALLNAWKRNEKFLVYTLTGKEKKTLDEHYFSTGYKIFPESDKKWMRQMRSVTFSHAFMKYGAIHWGPGHLTEEQLEILQRFSKVFEQSYTRFLDLQKAEAQAREAKIETALEKVRSRSLAMHKADELGEVATVVFEKLRELDIPVTEGVAIVTHIEGSKDQVEWMENPGMPSAMKFFQPYYEHPILADYWNAKNQGLEFIAPTYTAKQSRSFFNHIFEHTDYKHTPQKIKDYCLAAESYSYFAAFQKNSSIFINDYSGRTFTEQEIEIVKRFSKVFEQAYVRFLDLQKAETQTREAQIESALERVRSKTMAMYRSEELDTVIKTVYAELKHLDVSFKRCFIMIFDEHKGATWWMGSPDDDLFHQGFYVQYHTHPPHLAYLKGWEERQQKWEYWLRGQIKKDWDEFVFKETELSKLPPIVIHDMKSFDFAYLAASFENFGCMTTGGIETLSEESFSILRRFAKVFDQTYTRFKDLKQAESQAREAQIEASLERVRSRSMAMHKSEDLHEVIKVVTEQLSVLSLKFNAANFAKIDPDGSWDLWLSTPEQAYPAIIHVPYLDHPIFNDITEQISKDNDFYTRVYNQEEANIFFHHFFENTIAINTAEERKRFVYSSKGFARSLFLTKNIWFSVSRYDAISFSDEENAIFKRFANVFEQAYTRFLDLQKAEAQAREADIELSLERVRAKTMAMQKPAEFVDVINEIGEQFVHLGFDIEWVNFGANGLDISKGIDIWNFAVIPGSPPISARVFIPYFDHSLFINAVEELDKYRRTGNDFFITALNKDDKDSWLDHLFTKTIFKDVPEEYRAIQYAKPGYTTSNIALKDTWLSIGKFDLKNFTEEQHTILRRFAKAFGQAYTRFLDLQKAEAQAREAQIEASLERVRSRAMAMQSSEELRELIGTVFTELTKLDIVLTRCLIMIYDPRSNDSIWWMANSEAPTQPMGLRIQNHQNPPYAAYLKAWQEKKLKWVYVLEGAVKKDWDDFIFVETELSQLPDFVIAGMKAPERVYLNSSFNSFGNLTLASLEPLSEEHFDILLRFAKVFDLTYTRFNDLKQAEAQAKESRIQLALERVRARTMAMQKSNELTETSFLLFQQLKELGSVASQISIGIINEQENVMEMSATIDGSKLDFVINVSLDEPIVMKKLVGAWKEQKKSLVVDLSGDELKTYNDYRNSTGKLKFETKEGDHWVIHIAFFAKGILSFSSHERHSDEIVQLLERFAAVFDLTFTRFLDLQKAEAQTREAQIELALERVRARTMAMHKSEELAETAQVLFQQLSELGGIPDRIAIGIADETNAVVNFWTTDQQGGHLDHSFSARLNERTTIAKTYQAWKEQKKSLVVDLQGEELNEWIQFAREEMGIAVKDDQIKDRRVHTLAYFSHGWILVTSHEPQLPGTIQILERFASVFNLTYRRFLDLQKAEAQANDARIEIALERIRARALAMHKSDELMEVAKVLREQMALLGQPELEASVVHLYEEDPDHILSWRAFRPTDSHDKIAYGHMSLPKNSCEFVREWLTKFYSEEKEYTIELSGAKQDEWYDLFFKFAPDVINSMHQDNSIHDKRYYRFSKFSGGALLMISKQEPSAEVIYLQKRAAVVFDLAYRRFSDLQKTEAQAREALIEASLERVRAKAMAMHKSEDLHEAVKIMFEEFQKLNLDVLRCGVGILNKDSRTGSVWATSVSDDGLAVQISANESFDTHPLMTLIYENWQKQEDLDYILQGQDLINYYRAMKESDLKLPESQLAFSEDELQPQYYYGAMFKAGGLYAFKEKPFAEEDRRIMKRFASVVNLTYNRFRDLQAAEASAREAQIETALEKVRSHTMGMRSSEDLANVASVMFDQMRILGGDLFSFGIVLCDKHENMVEQWHSIPGAGMMAPFFVPVNLDHIHQYRYDQWKAGTELFSIVIPEDYIARHFELMLELPSVKAEWEGIAAQGISLPAIPTWEIDYGASFRYGYLLVSALKPFEEDKIFPRFAKVFEQAYTRFLDLQKAELQAREALIEAALERVRSKTMAMHNSQDVGETVATMFDELVKLGIEALRCGIGVMHEGYRMEVWTAKQGANKKAELVIGQMDMRMHALTKGVYSGWQNKEQSFSYELKDDDLIEYFTALNSSSEYPMRYEISSLPSTQFHNSFYFPEGVLYVFSLEQLPVEYSQICKRFAGIFGQTYRRYLDLQKAEANAREAQIEAGLERVRARTMAMHNSEDVGAATATMFTELEKLGIQNLRGGITIIKAGDKQEVWGVTNLPDGRTIRSIGEFDMHLHALWRELLKAKLNNGDFNYYLLAGKDKDDYINLLNATPNYLSQPIKDFPDVHVQSYFFGEGAIWTNSLEPHSEEQKQTMKRFASVFSLTFRRYQDLKKAEAQAREATIEAALERVRGKAMAMHSSKDLATTIGVFYHELEGLNLTPRRCGVGLIDKEKQTAEISTMNASADGQSIELVGVLDMRRHPVLTSVYNNWLTKTEYHPVLRGNEIKEYYQLVRPQIDFPDYPNDTVQYGYFFYFDEGGVYAWTEKELNEEELKIYRRFTSVLSLTYKRYKDLKDAESRTQAAIKDAALDRIRADIASMRTINDLDRITPLIWNELTVLGIPFIRCGVFIMDEEQELIHTFLSTPDGKAIAAFHLPYDTPGNLSQVLTNWKENRNYIDHWDESEFRQFADILVKQGTLASAEQYLKTIPKGGFYLHFLPFLQGMLYVGNTTQLEKEEIELIQHVADAFSTAYARYEDFNKLEAAKQQVDKTLTDLKQAQTQLVQSEKMASLGELTAGIAHEIQNPLNFVNNFSDVSSELLEEMKNELEKGNKEDAIAIVEDVKQNLEKILHHGKRADAIVKSMLQHSRSSSGKKEPADINGLADEYLRLAYHGLRAKDKSFNAKFETEFDSSIGKINIISQDIGRVLVNLINNAFYAVSERKKQESNGYEPTVTVYTKKTDDKIEIKVKDNGNGIPQKVLDKIFQPFFTTKPTGQGTGLGLSLAYDIITKGHGGELKVETREGEGTEFIIQLPVSKANES